jgi:hypothetical protein
MSLGCHTIYAIAIALAVGASSACGDDEPSPSAAGSGAGTTSSGGSGEQGGQGGSGSQSGQGGEAATDAAAGSGGSTQGAAIDAGSDAGPELEGCVVAQRIDECCTSWVPVTRAEAFRDPCLVAFGEPPANNAGAQACLPEFCPELICPILPVPSHVAEPVGPNGACAFVEECSAEAECVIAVDMSRCCPCPEALPETLVEREPCVILASTSALPDGCLNLCPADCIECPDVPEPSCSARDGGAACQ